MAQIRKKKVSSARKSFLAAGTGKTVESYQRNMVVVAQGDPADSVFRILNGKVKITVLSRQGKEAVLAILGPGDFFGVKCLGGKARRAATATTLTECSIMRIEKHAVQRALHDDPKFQDLFCSFILSRIRRLEEDLADQLFNSSERRLARALLLLANFGKGGKSALVDPTISQETLAEMIGTTRSRVSFFMNKFRRQGFIEYNDQLLVRSSLLKVLLGD